MAGRPLVVASQFFATVPARGQDSGSRLCEYMRGVCWRAASGENKNLGHTSEGGPPKFNFGSETGEKAVSEEKVMRAHRKLTSDERDKIAYWYAVGEGIREIARRLRRSPSSISDEIKRNKMVDDIIPSVRTKPQKHESTTLIRNTCSRTAQRSNPMSLESANPANSACNIGRPKRPTPSWGGRCSNPERTVDPAAISELAQPPAIREQSPLRANTTNRSYGPRPEDRTHPFPLW